MIIVHVLENQFLPDTVGSFQFVTLPSSDAVTREEFEGKTLQVRFHLFWIKPPFLIFSAFKVVLFKKLQEICNYCKSSCQGIGRLEVTSTNVTLVSDIPHLPATTKEELLAIESWVLESNENRAKLVSF